MAVWTPITVAPAATGLTDTIDGPYGQNLDPYVDKSSKGGQEKQSRTGVAKGDKRSKGGQE